MKGTDTGKDKVKKICEILRQETLEPAKMEAEEVLHTAKEQAAKIIAAAHEEAERIHLEAQEEITRQENVFQSSLTQACKQALLSLRQSIEEKLFNPELHKLLVSSMQDPKVLAQLITAVVHAIEKEGIDADLSVYVPASVPARSVNALLVHEILEKLKEKSVLLGSMTGGVEVKLHKENLTIDISDRALKELVAGYIRKDFRTLIFGHG